MNPKIIFKTGVWGVIPLFFLGGCWVDPYNAGHDYTGMGYRPVYGTQESREIKFDGPRTLKNPGKIYVYGQYLLVNEKGEGIHVFDNTDPANPVAQGFIRVLGNTDMAIRNDILYADHLGNLVAIQISSFNDLKKTGSLPLQNWDLGVPPPSNSYFECVDSKKGVVVSWQSAELQNPGCYAY